MTETIPFRLVRVRVSQYTGTDKKHDIKNNDYLHYVNTIHIIISFYFA